MRFSVHIILGSIPENLAWIYFKKLRQIKKWTFITMNFFFRGGVGNIRWGIPLPGLTQVNK